MNIIPTKGEIKRMNLCFLNTFINIPVTRHISPFATKVKGTKLAPPTNRSAIEPPIMPTIIPSRGPIKLAIRREMQSPKLKYPIPPA